MRNQPGHFFTSSSGILIGLLSLVLLSACKHKPQPVQSDIELPQAFSDSGISVLPADWWTVFNSEELNQLIEQSSRSNFDLLLAWERLRAAQALLKRETSRKWPTVDGRLDGQVQDPAPGSGNSWDIGLYAAYELDLWGRIQSRVDAERFRADASEADYQTAMLTLTAEITRAYLQLLTAEAELGLVRSQLETNRKIFNSLKARFGAGQGERADILRQAQLVEASRGQMYLAEAQVQLLRNQVAVLTGRMPGSLELAESATWPVLPELPQTGLPGELIRRRPDIMGDFNRLKAADADLAAAVSESYPRVSFNASIITEEDNLSDVFDDWISRLAGSVLMPVFDGFERRAEVERSEAIRNQNLYSYSQSVLNAVREVEDALILESRQAMRLASLQEQVRLAGESHQQLQLQYINGAADFLDVLTALTNEQRLRRDLLQVRLDLFESRIALYRAIAGPIQGATISLTKKG